MATLLTEMQVQSIEEFANKRYAELDSTHGPEHGTRTARLAVYIATQEDADVEICRLGALLHQYHPENVALVDAFLKSLNIDEVLRFQLVHCVECVEPATIGRAHTLEARVVFDADKLQALGPFGLIREVAYRVNTRGIDFLQATREARDLQIEMTDLLQTRTARDIARELNASMDSIYSLIEKWDDLSFLDIQR
ncbi:MAG: hypothetical protein K9W43_10790 [Candidatus Thorarchaeota archaeon]|nr:hypothetical protein [Candidatus Thorarchaeota archaeon]